MKIEQVYDARNNLRDIIRSTDIIHAQNLSFNNDIYFKTENLQKTGSFKLRGAYYKILNLSEEEKSKGVVACSAGNHAQGVALACMKLNVKAKIFIPSAAPISKVEATKSYGADVVLVDGVYDDAYNVAIKYVEESGCTFVHPFDDEDVIAGQGTIGLEILEDLPNVDVVIAPIGGGGLISGVAYAIKTLNSKCKVYGVQAVGAASMHNNLAQNHKTPIAVDKISTFADGIAVKTPGKITSKYCKKYVDEIVLVSDDEIATAMLKLIEEQKLITEGAGAVSYAALLFNKIPLKNKKVCCILSGGNIDVNILSRVIHRGLLMSGRLSDITVELIDRPGQLQEVASLIAKTGANVVSVNHNYGGENMDINGCYLRIAMETRNPDHLIEIKEVLTNAGYKIVN